MKNRNLTNYHFRIKKGDTVKIMLGKDRGKTGKVEKIFSKTSRLKITGINLYKKHRKAQGEGRPGGIIEINRPLLVCKVALLCPKCQQPTRVGFRQEAKRKLRICKKCQGVIQ